MITAPNRSLTPSLNDFYKNNFINDQEQIQKEERMIKEIKSGLRVA